MKKNMKKVTLRLSILAVAGAIIILPSTTDAYRGDPNVQGPNYSLERHTAMQNAFENHDFEAWKSLMQDMGKVRVVEVINADNFDRFVEAHELASQGKFEEAKTIRQELGLGLKDVSGRRGAGMRMGMMHR